jgi:thiol-disulfide isomerase/thioredoxin
MRPAALTLALWCGLASAQTPILVNEVRLAAASGDLTLGRQELKQFRAARGATPEYIEALSWLGRGELALRNYGAAEATSAEVRKLCLAQLSRRKLDADASLPMALGASIEVQAMAAAIQGRRDEAVLFLRDELRRWDGTSIQTRIRKNLNLLSLEGKPAPALELAQSVTKQKLLPIAAHQGHPVLLFFWAHWCSDCKQEIGIIQRMQQTFGRAGLVVIAPTQHYGYVAGGQDASRDVESRYIREVWGKYYAGLGNIETPVSEQNFAAYGVSTTPTLVLVDGRGVVRLYNPGALSEEQLSGKIKSMMGK